MSRNGQTPDIISVCFVKKWSRLRHSGLDHFMTKQTDTMSEVWPFHDNTDWYYIWGLTISWHNRLTLWSVCYVMKWSISRQCESVISWNGQAPDIVSVCYVMKWSNLRHSSLGLEHFITKQTDTMSEIWLFHDKTDWYYVWSLTILWHNRLTLCLGIYHFMTKQTDTILGLDHFMTIVSVCYVMKWSNLRHSISLFCDEMLKPQT
jgi:hypothetical protein